MSLDSQSSQQLLTTDPNARFLGVSCLDLLLIEVVPMAERMTAELNGTSSSKTATTETATTISGKLEDEELREATFYRLESLGYRVGQGLAERFSRDRPRFADNLDVIKFICKDLWTILFKKQVDNLKTNHRGVYVLSDNSFRPLTRMSMTVRVSVVSLRAY
ncbi:hypothetical protein UA08_07884 [Talaromyces atroroseus]|uniref:Trafficking protein particle complex subunit 6B n=1 Tax=Talaromyces atroroseus TaxID=1441469 RepID=A0A225AP49_TALAT|nr:hypothetical protein UA08_07884 [Talaromyces atroroseus]OKL56746.1 hypothetical protein UA08_07884 [Talaromyces atroroseus]